MLLGAAGIVERHGELTTPVLARCVVLANDWVVPATGDRVVSVGSKGLLEVGIVYPEPRDKLELVFDGRLVGEEM